MAFYGASGFSALLLKLVDPLGLSTFISNLNSICRLRDKGPKIWTHLLKICPAGSWKIYNFVLFKCQLFIMGRWQWKCLKNSCLMALSLRLQWSILLRQCICISIMLISFANHVNFQVSRANHYLLSLAFSLNWCAPQFYPIIWLIPASHNLLKDMIDVNPIRGELELRRGTVVHLTPKSCNNNKCSCSHRKAAFLFCYQCSNSCNENQRNFLMSLKKKLPKYLV